MAYDGPNPLLGFIHEPEAHPVEVATEATECQTRSNNEEPIIGAKLLIALHRALLWGNPHKLGQLIMGTRRYRTLRNSRRYIPQLIRLLA